MLLHNKLLHNKCITAMVKNAQCICLLNYASFQVENFIIRYPRSKWRFLRNIKRSFFEESSKSCHAKFCISKSAMHPSISDVSVFGKIGLCLIHKTSLTSFQAQRFNVCKNYRSRKIGFIHIVNSIVGKFENLMRIRRQFIDMHKKKHSYELNRIW